MLEHNPFTTALPTAFFKHAIVGKTADLVWQEPTLIEPKKLLVLIVQPNADTSVHPIVDKLLQACKLTQEECAIVGLHDGVVQSWVTLKKKYAPKYVLCFGNVSPLLGWQALLQPHMVQHFDDTTWIVTGNLESLAVNEEMKKHLWLQMLKPIFS